MTKREYYDLLVRSAHDGTFPSVGLVEGKPGCLYRGEGKKRCAAGLLIPDDKYDRESCEGKIAEYVLGVGRMELPEGLSRKDINSIQATHDSVAFDYYEEKALKWDPELFVSRINRLPCFQEFQK